jgi:hypothetical protein
MRGGDLTVDVVGGGAAHGRGSIGTALRAFNVVAALVFTLVTVSPAAALPVPGTDGRVTLNGWFDGLAVAATEDSPTQRPQLVTTLQLDGRFQRWLRGYVETKGRAGGPFIGGQGAGVYEFDQAFQNRSPALEFAEAWLEGRSRRFEVRAGIVRVAWGKLDGIPPSDIVNPRDFHDPLVTEAEERKIGIPMLTGTYHAPLEGWGFRGLRLGLLYVPIAVPSRLPLAEERWFPSSTEPPARFDLRPLHLGTLESARVVFGTANVPPPRGLEDGGIGARLGGSWHSADWDLYHYTGPWTGADAALVPILVPESATELTSYTSLAQKHDSLNMTAGAVAFPVGPVTVRAEVVHFNEKPYLRRASDLVSPAALRRLPLMRIEQQLLRGQPAGVPLEPLFPTLDSLEWGVGVDTVWRGFQPILQVNQVAFLEAAPRLLIGDPDTRFTASVRKNVLDERFEVEVRGQYAVERGDWFFFPRVSYLLRDDLRVRVGYLTLGGPRASLLGQYGQNDEVVLQARYSF